MSGGERVTAAEIRDRFQVGRNTIRRWLADLPDPPQATQAETGRWDYSWDEFREFMARNGLPRPGDILGRGSPEHAKRVPEYEGVKRVIDLHAAEPGITHAEVAQRFGISAQTAARHVATARRFGSIGPASAAGGPADGCGYAHVNVWTDASLPHYGADKNAFRPHLKGSWAANFLTGDEQEFLLTGVERVRHDIGRLELIAVVRAVAHLTEPACVIVRTDCQYVAEWYGRIREGQQPRRDADLWAELEEVAARHHLTVLHVRGHAWSQRNKAADRAARLARRNKGPGGPDNLRSRSKR